jgi:hypothetical protein
LQCYLYALVGGGVDALPDQPFSSSSGLARDVCFCVGYVDGRWGGMQTVQRTRGAPDGVEAISSGARSMYLPFPPRPKSSSLGSPARRDTRQPPLSRRDLTPATHDSSSSRGGGHQSRWQEPREESHKIQIPKHANKAYPPDGRPGGTMTHIDGLSTSACTG